MKLKVVLGQGQTTWTLKPEQKYIVFGGCGDCDITLPQAQPGDIDDRHIAFSFNTAESTWYIEDLNSTSGTYIGNRPITRSAILQQTQIAIANKVFLFATPISPASMTATTVQPTSNIQPPPVYGAPPQTAPMPVDTYRPRSYEAPIKVLTWSEFVENQVRKGDNWFDRVAIRFFMVTGLRNTPWISLNDGCGLDGYIIPDFKEPATKIASGIEANLGQLRQYEDTDCNVVLLTDAHLVGEIPDAMLALPLKRGGKKDFRRFFVVSHHRIRTYVVVDNYGTDLFVGRITRFEAQLNGAVPFIFIVLFALLTLLLTVASGSAFYGMQGSVFLWSVIILSAIWYGVFIGAPRLMQKFDNLPVPSNLYGIFGLMLLALWMFFGLLTLLFPAR